MTAPTERRRTIVGLHYLRALATIMVVVVHAFSIAAHPEYFKVRAFDGFFSIPSGEIDFFFVMSGFIMVASTYDARTRTPRMSALEFLRRRFLRIFPLLWVAVVAYAALRFLGKNGTVEMGNYLRAMSAWPVGAVDPNVTWTIRHEVAFYLVFGVFFLALARYAGLALIWFGAPLALALATGAWTWTSEDLTTFLCSPYNLEFGLGVAIGLVHLHVASPIRTLRHQLPLLCAAVLALRVLVYLTGLNALYGTLLYVLALAPFLVLIVMFAVKTDPIAESKPMVFLGDASYSIFLFHPHFITPLFMALARFAPGLPSWVAALIVIAAIIPLTCLVHVLVEKPLMRTLNLRFHTLPFAGRPSGRRAEAAPREAA